MRSLYGHCIETLQLEEDGEDAVYVFAESVLYLAGYTQAFDFQNLIRQYCKTQSPKVFRLSLREYRYSNLSIKLYAIKLSKSKCTTTVAKQIAQCCGVSSRDSRLIYKLIKFNPWFASCIADVADSILETNEYLKPSRVDLLFAPIFKKVLPYIKHIAFKKLRFIARSTNSELADLHSELSHKVVQAFYSTVPIDMPDLYIINYLKRAVHNHAMNMIKTHTTQKRGRLVEAGFDRNKQRQFELLTVSENQFTNPTTTLGDGVDAEDPISARLELQWSITEYMDSVKAKSRKHKFLALIMGSEDKEFSNWLRCRGVSRPSEDNVDVQDRVGQTTYLEYVSTYLSVSRKNVDSLFDSIKAKLALEV